jgi:ABC-type transport system involved in multi-copper enzyme maturation permease subunit
MLALLKKDLKLNRVPIFGGGLLIAIPYLILSPRAVFSEESSHMVVSQDAGLVLGMALLLTVGVTAVFGGAAFALERRERSAEFLAMLPVSRWKIVASKLVIGVGFPAIFWLVDVAARKCLHHFFGSFESVRDQIPFYFTVAAFAMPMAFGIGWLASSVLRSPAVAACISIGVTLAWVLCVLMVIASPEGIGNGVRGLLIGAPLVLGVWGTWVGARLFVRRVEP